MTKLLKKSVVRMFLVLWIVVENMGFAPCFGQVATIRGYVRELGSNEPISGATLTLEATRRRIQTNSVGYFSFSALPGQVQRLRITAVAYAPSQIEVLPDTLDGFLTITLAPNTLDSVDIEGSRIPPASLGRVVVPIADLKRIPAILGEVDIIKALDLIPGFNLGVEGGSGLFVRGGSPDQNLILLDGIPVYNAAHLFGFLSIFHPDVVQSLEAYKAAFPAKYGGRLSSVIDIKTKEGSTEKRQGNAAIGLLSSRIFWEGPIGGSKKTTFILGARASYLGLLTLPLYFAYQGGSADFYAQYWLADGNARIQHRFSNGGQLSLSLYAGQDILATATSDIPGEAFSQSLQWGNYTASLQYRQPLGKKFFWNSLLAGSRYRYGLSTKGELTLANDSLFTTEQFLASGIRDLTWKNELSWYAGPGHTFSAGAELSSWLVTPGLVRNENSINGILKEVEKKVPAQSAAGFVEWNGELSSRLSVQVGLRASAFRSDTLLGPYWEPRARLAYRVNDRWSVQASASVMRQFLQLVSTNGIGLPNDVYIPASAQFLPSVSRGVSAGVFHALPRFDAEISVEAYAKQFDNLLDFQLGTNLLENIENLEGSVLRGGIGRAYGLELFASKSVGRWKGWLGYTLAWSEQQFEGVNGGNWFPARFDRRHDLSLTGSYDINKRFSVSGSFVFQSGSPVSFPVALIPYVNPGFDEPTLTAVYGLRSNARMPNYHRMDLGFQYRPYGRENRTWSFGAYNVYNQQNPFYLRVRPVQQGFISGNPIPPEYRVEQTSFIPFLPYLSYEWKF